jgi:hypothetical protein
MLSTPATEEGLSGGVMRGNGVLVGRIRKDSSMTALRYGSESSFAAIIFVLSPSEPRRARSIPFTTSSSRMFCCALGFSAMYQNA